MFAAPLVARTLTVVFAQVVSGAWYGKYNWAKIRLLWWCRWINYNVTS